MVRYANSVNALVKEVLAKALFDWFGVGEDKCPVLLAGQVPVQTAARYVNFHKLNSHQLGFQGKTLKTDCSEDGGFAEIEHWIDETTFQINCRTKAKTSDRTNTVAARDMADGIRAWFNSYQGIEFLRSRKLATLRVSDIRDAVSTDESDLFENTSSLDVVFQIGQSRVREIPSQDARLKRIVSVPLSPSEK